MIVTNAMLWVAGAGRVGEPNPEVHLYLYDRYSRLAEHYDRRGNWKKASRLRAKADAHCTRSGCDERGFPGRWGASGIMVDGNGHFCAKRIS